MNELLALPKPISVLVAYVALIVSRDERCPVRAARFDEYEMGLAFDVAQTYGEPPGDLLVAQPLGEQVGDLILSRGESRDIGHRIGRGGLKMNPSTGSGSGPVGGGGAAIGFSSVRGGGRLARSMSGW